MEQHAYNIASAYITTSRKEKKKTPVGFTERNRAFFAERCLGIMVIATWKGAPHAPLLQDGYCSLLIAMVPWKLLPVEGLHVSRQHRVSQGTSCGSHQIFQSHHVSCLPFFLYRILNTFQGKIDGIRCVCPAVSSACRLFYLCLALASTIEKFDLLP